MADVRRAVLVVAALAVAAGCGGGHDDRRLALDGAKSTALAVWQTSEDGAGLPGSRTIRARRDGDCYAVEVIGGDGPPQVVVLRRPAQAEPTLHGWEILGVREDLIDRLDGSDEGCGFH
jgi:hypothetical protein